VDILKGNKNIAEINIKGSLFGEMSFFLGARRTATVKARSEVKAIRIPQEEIANFLRDFPNVAEDITKLLAQRLNETSHMLYGLKEFCDQLPDAVILTDKEGKIFTWNSAAEKLYGRDSHQMRYKSAADIYEEPQVYRNFLEEVQSKDSVSEKIIRIRHPKEGTRFISTSMTLLYDDQDNFQGVLSLGRDVTAIQTMEKRFRRTRYWLIPSFLLLGLLASAIFLGYPYFSKGFETMDVKKQELRNQLAKDYFLLKSLLVDHFGKSDRLKTSRLMQDFFDIQETNTIPYIGLVLLDKEKKVFAAYSIKINKNIKGMVGSSYAGIVFQEIDNSIHRVLTLYRTDKEHPMGYKGIEIAFKMSRDNQPLGWLVFQMNVDLLRKTYKIDEKGLKTFQFKRK
jgi:PAS domain S-box-containing protein